MMEQSRVMMQLFSFRGRLGRRAFALAALPILVSQHAFALACLAATGRDLVIPWWFWLNPLRSLAGIPLPWAVPIGMALAVAVDWLLAALAFRRTQDARGKELLATLTIVPVVQIPVILWLIAAPPARAPEPEPPSGGEAGRLRGAVQGLLAGAALCVAAAAFSTLVARTYGYGLFIASPFVIGVVAAYLANRKADLGSGPTARLVLGSLLLGGVALVGVALEGIVCLAMASPLIAGMGIIGAILGRALARIGKRGGRTTLMSVAVLPLIMLGETVMPPRASFDSVEAVEVAASPAAVWDAVVHMGPIPGAPAAPFRCGLAYPMRGEIHGTGVGSIRRGVFSTGVAYERVTEWRPGRKLSFIVLSDPPTMRELSPYRHVNAPHVSGYFKTLDARFTITPLADGRTRLALATRHELDLEPALYWLPFAQWAVHANKQRVLAHFRDQAEANPAPGPG